MSHHITIIGAGKVAKQLAPFLQKKRHVIDAVWARNQEKGEKFAHELNTHFFTDLSEISKDSLAIICVSDSAINSIVQKISPEIKTAYTSGSVRLEDLETRGNLGVFYPLQTFSEGSNVDISEVPFLIESHNKVFEKELEELAKSISSNVLLASSQDRFNTHIAAVMVNNFTNFLYFLAEEHLKEHELNFDILRPLIKETTRKLEKFDPRSAQTGPAVRGDQVIIDKHVQALSNPEVKELYKKFSELIEKEFKKS